MRRGARRGAPGNSRRSICCDSVMTLKSGEIGVDLRDGCANRGEDGLRVGGGAQFEGCSSDVLRRIHGGVDVAAQIAIFRIAYDADDFVAGIGWAVFVRRRLRRTACRGDFPCRDILRRRRDSQSREWAPKWECLPLLEAASSKSEALKERPARNGMCRVSKKFGTDAEGVGFGVLILRGAGPVENGDHQAVAEERHHGVAGGFHAGSLRRGGPAGRDRSCQSADLCSRRGSDRCRRSGYCANRSRRLRCAGSRECAREARRRRARRWRARLARRRARCRC